MNKLPVLMQNKESFDYASYDISEKEQEIIHQVALGRSNKEIAEALFLSEGTVRNYISSILEKLSLKRPDAAGGILLPAFIKRKRIFYDF